jgi:hypothetical protein
MADVTALPHERRPLIAIVSTVPLVGEAAGSALEFGEVRFFAGRRDTVGLLSSLRPDAVVVDHEEDADAARAFAREHELTALHIGVRTRTLSLLEDGEWKQIGNGEGPTPESIRNAVAGSLFSRKENLQ